MSQEYATDYLKAMEITTQIDNISKELAFLYTQWEKLSECD